MGSADDPTAIYHNSRCGGRLRPPSVNSAGAQRYTLVGVVNLGGFSWKRAIGLSAAKARLSRRIGIPLTKGGRQRKLGRMISGGGGCLVVLAATVAIPVALVTVLIVFFR